MKISIITVTYNSEVYLKTCIESVLSQKYNDIEYIIVDGSSTDGTIEIIKGYKSQISHFISEPDGGIYDAINKGIRLASGDVVGILNSDDFFSDCSVVANIAKEFDREKNLSVLYADVVFVERENSGKVIRYYSSKGFRSWMFRFGFQPAHPTFYAKRELFNKLGYYRTDLAIAGDFELLTRFFTNKDLICKYLNKQLVTMRVGGVSSSGLSSVKRLNIEINKALKLNNIYSNSAMIYSKYLFKWWGYIFK